MAVEYGDIATWVGVAAATVMSAAALIVSIRGLRHSARSADASQDSADSARRSATASERSAIAADRSADAAERQAVAAEKALPPPPPDVDWEISRVPGSRDFWALRNVGTKTATGVKIKHDPAAQLFEYKGEPVPPGGSIEVGILPSGGAPMPRELWVSWDGQPEPKSVPL